MNRSLWMLAPICMLFGITAAKAQVREIDRTKLPSDSAVQKAYDDLLPIEGFARTYETVWRFPVPRDQVVKQFRAAFAALASAQRKQPANAELQLLTGLVGHLAYNLEINEAGEPAYTLLHALAIQKPQDLRAVWFLGIHDCQGQHTVEGMNELLGVEASSAKQSADFWMDYANCASVSAMPFHAVHAYDLADRLNGDTPADPLLERTVRTRTKTSSNGELYKGTQAWSAIQRGDVVRFTSTLCGMAFSAKAANHLQLPDVTNETCSIVLEGEHYSTRTDPKSATFAVISQPASVDSTLEAFTQKFLNTAKYGSAKPMTGFSCPAAACLTYEIITDKMYATEGGAHLIAVAWASEPPAYPGILLEIPIPVLKAGEKPGTTIYHPDNALERLPGLRFTIAVMDANADIYARSRADFEVFLKTLVLDSK